MLVDDQVVVLNRRQNVVPGRVVERFQPGAVGWNQRQQNAASQTGFGNELDILDRFVQIVWQNQTDPRASIRIFGAEVLEPAVVRPDSGKRQFVVIGRRRLGGDDALSEKRGHGVRENHFADNPLTVLVGGADVEVPVAHLSWSHSAPEMGSCSRRASRRICPGTQDRDIRGTANDSHPRACQP